MALVLFCWATNQSFFKDVTNSDIRRSFLDQKEDLVEDLLTFSMSNGTEEPIEDNKWLF